MVDPPQLGRVAPQRCQTGDAYHTHTSRGVLASVRILVVSWLGASLAGEPKAGLPAMNDSKTENPVQLLGGEKWMKDWPEEASSVVRVCVSAKGEIGSVKIVQSSGVKSMDRHTVDKFSRGRYKPGTLNGRPVSSCKNYKVTYKHELSKSNNISPTP